MMALLLATVLYPAATGQTVSFAHVRAPDSERVNQICLVPEGANYMDDSTHFGCSPAGANQLVVIEVEVPAGTGTFRFQAISIDRDQQEPESRISPPSAQVGVVPDYFCLPPFCSEGP